MSEWRKPLRFFANPLIRVQEIRQGRTKLAELDHKNILLFLGTTVIADETYLLSPWLKPGDLAHLLRARSQFYEFSERERLCHIGDSLSKEQEKAYRLVRIYRTQIQDVHTVPRYKKIRHANRIK